jgi:hypothetical protein
VVSTNATPISLSFDSFDSMFFLSCSMFLNVSVLHVVFLDPGTSSVLVGVPLVHSLEIG